MKSSILKYIIGILCILMLVQGVYGESITVSRDIPKTADISSEVTVSLKMDVASKDVSGVVVRETIPEGWSASSVSNEGSFDPDAREIKWIIYGSMETKTLSYNALAPPNEGEYAFNGTYTTLEEGVGETAGNYKITIKAKETAPVPEEKKEDNGYNKILMWAAAVIVVVVIVFVLIKLKNNK